MPKTLNIGLIGVGRLGVVYARYFLGSIAHARLTAVSDVNEKAQQAFADENDVPKRYADYRTLLADAMPFGKNARIQLEHGGVNESLERYRSVTFWYGRRGACLIRSDSLDVGDDADERAHRYASPTATEIGRAHV